jgi:hypothetical protein
LAGNRHHPLEAIMSDTRDSKQRLLSIFDECQTTFSHELHEHINTRDWKVTLKLERLNGRLAVTNRHSLSDQVVEIYVAGAIDGVLSFIDILSNTTLSKPTTDEVEGLKKRVARIEMELLNLLPPEFTNPSSAEPDTN